MSTVTVVINTFKVTVALAGVQGPAGPAGSGGNARTIQTLSSTGNISSSSDIIYFTGSTGTGALPAGVNDMLKTIKNTGSGDFTVTPNGSDTIQGSTEMVLAPGQSRQIHFYNGKWEVL